MRISLHNINCIFKRKFTFLRLLKNSDRGGFCLNIHLCHAHTAIQSQRNGTVANRSKVLRLRRVGQLLERLTKIGLIS